MFRRIVSFLFETKGYRRRVWRRGREVRQLLLTQSGLWAKGEQKEKGKLNLAAVLTG